MKKKIKELEKENQELGKENQLFAPIVINYINQQISIKKKQKKKI